jgi:peptidoglycan/xylan/chitin deacetylase (PgdA/CDA1 family)
VILSVLINQVMKKNLIINLHVVENAQWFETLIVYLKSTYKMVPIDYFDNIENFKKRNSLCNITFDDGDKTVYEVAFPILKKHNVPATLFVSPRSIVGKFNFWFQEIEGYEQNRMVDILIKELNLSGKDKSTVYDADKLKALPLDVILKTLPLDRINKIISIYQKETNTPPKEFRNMDLAQIRELHGSDLITFGAHTLYHPILKIETDERINEEITKSITELSELLDEKVNYFAYPNGTPNLDFGLREIACLKNNNIKIAFSTEPKFIDKNSDKMTFPRIDISKGSLRFIKMRLFLGPAYFKLKSLIRESEQSQRAKL